MSTEFRDADPQSPGKGEPQGTADASTGAVAPLVQAEAEADALAQTADGDMDGVPIAIEESDADGDAAAELNGARSVIRVEEPGPSGLDAIPDSIDDDAAPLASESADDGIDIDADDGDGDDALEFDDLEELDVEDFELLGTGTAGANPPATPPAAPPATPHAAPPPPPHAAPPPPVPGARPAIPRPPRAGTELGGHGAPVQTPAAAAPQVAPEAAHEPPTPPPLESLIEVPSCLERELEALATRAVETRMEALRHDLEHATDKQQLAALAYELGELSARRLDDEAAAVKAHGQALAADPSLRANLWAIRRVFYRRALWPNLIKLLDAEVRFARDDEERAGLLYEKGVVLADHLRQPAEAREAFERAMALDSRNRQVLRALERIAAQNGDLALLERVWLEELEASEQPATKVAIILDLVQVFSERGAAGLERARDLLSDAVALGADPNRVGRARIRLAELLDDGDELLAALEARVAQLLASVGPAGLPEAPASARKPGTPLDRGMELRLQVAAIRRRQAQLARVTLDDGDRAWDYLQQALTLAPGEPLILADLADLAERLERFDELAELVEGWSSVEGDPNRTLALSIRRIDALLRADKADQARSLIDAAATQAPGHLAVVAVAEREALARGDRAALAKAWMAAGEAYRLGTVLGAGVKPASGAFADAGRASSTFFIAAGDAFLEAGDTAQAIIAFQRAGESEPNSAAVTEALADAYEQAGQPAEARAVLQSLAATASPDQKRYLIERIARLSNALGDGDGLLAAEQALCALDATDSRSRWRLEHALAGAGRHAERVEVLLEIASIDTDPARRSHAAVVAARLCEDALGDATRALELYRKALELQPDDAYARASVLDLSRSGSDRRQFAAVLAQELAELPDGPRAIIAGRELADLRGRELADPAGAAAVLADLALRFPLDASIRVAALGWQTRTGDRARLLDGLESAAADADTESGGRLTLLQLGAELEHAGRGAESIDAYRRILVASPNDTVAALGLVEVGEREDDTAAVFEGLEALAANQSLGADAAAVWEDIGWRRAIALEDFEAAQTAFTNALAVDSGCRGATVGLALMAARTEDRAAQGAALAGLAGHLGRPTDQAALLLRAAALAEAEGHADLARQRARTALAVAGDHPATVIAAAEFLPLAWTQQTEIPASELAAALGARAKLASDAARDDWALDRAEVMEMAGALRQAATIASEIIGRRPHDLRALSLLRRIYERSGLREGLARVSVGLAKTLGDPEAKLGLLREAATIFDQELGKFELAVPVYRRILAADPGAAELGRLLEILRAHDDTGGLVEVLGHRLAWLEAAAAGGASMEPAVPLWVERGLVRKKIGDARGAGRDFDRALAVDPLEQVALQTAAEVAMGLGDNLRAVDYYRRFLEFADDRAARDAAELALATLLAENLDDVAGAIHELSRVIAHHPENLDYRERVVALAQRTGDWERAIAEIEEIERRRRNDAERARDVLRVAHIYRDRVGDTGHAKKSLERVRGLDPLNLDAIRDLAELVGATSKAERHAVLRHALADIRLAVSENPARPALYERLAAIAGWIDEHDARLFALSAMAALGNLSAEQQATLDGLRDRGASALREPFRPQPLAAEQRLSALSAGVDVVAAELWGAIAPGIASARSVTHESLGFGRGDRLPTKHLASKHPVVAAVKESLGVGEIELYVSTSRLGVARTIAAEVPVVCLGADIANGDTAVARFHLGRTLADAAAGTGGLHDLTEDEVLAWLAAAAHESEAHAAGELAELMSKEASATQERARTLHRAMSRRERKHLAGLAGYFGRLADPRRYRLAALVASARAGLLYAGDMPAAFEILDVGQGGRAITDDIVAVTLLGWSVGEAHHQLRKAIGVSIGGES